MNPTLEMLAGLARTSGPRRLDLLHIYLEDGAREAAGLLMLDAMDRPIALTVGGLFTLGEFQTSPGAMLHWPVALGLRRVLTFHTQLYNPRFDIEPQDHEFAERLVHLAALSGLDVVDHVVFGPRPLYESLRRWPGWSWPRPASVAEMAGWPARYPRRPDPIIKDPVSGQSWAGRGVPPSWLVAALERGLGLDDFEIHFGDEDDLPPEDGIGAFQVVGPPTEPAVDRPPAGYRELRHDDEDVRLPLDGPAAMAVVEQLVFDLERPPAVAGAVFFDDDGVPVEVPPGYWAPLELVRERPSTLFARCVAQHATQAVTFSRRPGRAVRTDEDLDLALRLVLLARLFGVVVTDHVLLGDDGERVTLRDRRLWAWPNADPLVEAWWPSAARGGLSTEVVRHPTTRQVWDRRGQKPGWVEELEAAGWPLEALIEPSP